MSRPAEARRASSRRHLFGQGAHEPYAGALLQGRGMLSLEPASPDLDVPPLRFRVQQWCEPATAAELALLLASGGPVLDVGCGPGRMLVAAASLGLRSVGVDSSAEAVTQARSRGARALHQSIFDALPHEGTWLTAVLLDGNIGIGGSIPTLLRRMKQVLGPTGCVLVEVELQATLDVSYAAIVRGAGNETSEPFPWSRVGSVALSAYAARTGWKSAQWISIPSTDRSAGSPEAGRSQERLICRLVPRQ